MTRVHASTADPSPPRRARWRAAVAWPARSAWGATAAYTVLAVVLTWPLARGLGRDIPSDLGDPLLNTWILAWVADHLWRILGGDLTAFATFWHANIFYPEPYALAYSEALLPQAVQILPVYGLTKNAILCYDLVFLSTFVLSGLGTYLLVRQLAGDGRAAFVAGLLYGFALYRVSQFPHLQVLSSQWMPFVLYGLRRYFEAGHGWALAGAGLALLVQNLSCGYYLFFFAPILGVYLVWELVTRERWRDLRPAAAVSATLVAAYGATAAVLWPYYALGSHVLQRGMEEILYYSADVYSYVTTHEAVRLWGPALQVLPKPEGELFPGATPVVLSLLALAWQGRRAWRRAAASARDGSPRPWWLRWRPAIAAVAAVVLVLYVGAFVLVLVRGRSVFYVGDIRVRVTDLSNLTRVALSALVVLLAASRRARALARELVRSDVGVFAALGAAALFFSFGPRIRTMGHGIGEGPYTWLMALVPGFETVRVPARFAMIVALALAVLSGLGLAAVARRRPRAGAVLAAAAGLVFLLEGAAVPLQLNQRGYEPGLRPPDPGPVRQGDAAPAVYRHAAALPDDTVLVEFPFGAFVYDFQYLFYSIGHRKPLVNGFSGFFPPSYDERRARLRLPALLEDPDAAWNALARSGATHAIVHTRAFLHDEPARIGMWLESHGARLVGTFEYDRLYVLPRALTRGARVRGGRATASEISAGMRRQRSLPLCVPIRWPFWPRSSKP